MFGLDCLSVKLSNDKPDEDEGEESGCQYRLPSIISTSIAVDFSLSSRETSATKRLKRDSLPERVQWRPTRTRSRKS